MNQVKQAKNNLAGVHSSDPNNASPIKYNSSKYTHFEEYEQIRFLENKDFDLKSIDLVEHSKDHSYNKKNDFDASSINVNDETAKFATEFILPEIYSKNSSDEPEIYDTDYIAKFDSPPNINIPPTKNSNTFSNFENSLNYIPLISKVQENENPLDESAIKRSSSSTKIKSSDSKFVPQVSSTEFDSCKSSELQSNITDPNFISDNPVPSPSDLNFNSKRNSNVYSIGKLAYLAKRKSKFRHSSYVFSPAFNKTLENASLVSDYLENQKKAQNYTSEMMQARDKFLESNTQVDLLNMPNYIPNDINYSESSFNSSRNSFISENTSKHNSQSPYGSDKNSQKNSIIPTGLKKSLILKISEFDSSSNQNDSHAENIDYRTSLYLDSKFKELQEGSRDVKLSSLFMGDPEFSANNLLQKDHNISTENHDINQDLLDVNFTGFKIQNTVSNILLRAGLSSVALKMAQSNLKRGTSKHISHSDSKSTRENHGKALKKLSLPAILINEGGSLRSKNSLLYKKETKAINFPNIRLSETKNKIQFEGSNETPPISAAFRSIPLENSDSDIDSSSIEIVDRIQKDNPVVDINGQSMNGNHYMTVSEMRAMRLMYVDYVDKYGFLVFLNDKNNSRDAKNNRSLVSMSPNSLSGSNSPTDEKLSEERCIDKWYAILTMFPPESIKKSKKLQRLAQKGFPDPIRAQIYWCLMGVRKNYYRILNGKSFKQEYEHLISMDPNISNFKDDGGSKSGANSYDKLVEIIERDLSRSFPSHALFYDESCGGQDCLRRVLIAYLKYNPEVGYCQGMNLIVGLLMIIGMPEIELFWTLAALLDSHLLNYFTPDLSMIQVHAGVFGLLLHDHNPKLASHLEKTGCEPLMYVTPWFMTVFSMSLPWKSVLRIWDWFIFRGSKVLFRIALGIMDILSNHLLTKCQSLESQLEYILHMPQDLMGPDDLIHSADKVKISSYQIQKYTSQLTQKLKKNI
ncbi:TBC1 domain family member 10B [Smittium mucronatum]|uniref:TBC1 domain family member 10B n=1 Tax=Smittium mucronatum TaxID=133383 RepID=A0A1R0GQ43_9FUNG|nr:TBC1 domain family member 10B [Smittium mucronatum]